MDQDRTLDLYEDIKRLMWVMVSDICTYHRWQLNPDEVFGELSLELVKVCGRYPELEKEELIKVAVVSLRNRIRDLANFCYNTHRKYEDRILNQHLFDAITDRDNKNNGRGFEQAIYIGLETLVINVQFHNFELEDFSKYLSHDAYKLLVEILNPSERTLEFMDIFVARKNIAYDKGHWSFTITPLLMQRALGWTEVRITEAWDEIRINLANG